MSRTQRRPPGAIANALFDVFNKNTRKELDKQKHFVPLSIPALKITIEHSLRSSGYPMVTLDEFRNKIITDFSEVCSNRKIKVEANGFVTETGVDIDKYLPALVVQNNETVGALFSGYDSAGKFLFSNILNKSLKGLLTDVVRKAELDSEETVTRKQDTEEYHRGHIFGTGGFRKTPLQAKIEALLNEISRRLTTNPAHQGLQGLQKVVQDKLNNLNEKSTYGVKLEVALTKELTDALQSIEANVIVIQDGYENVEIYANLYEGPAWRSIEKLLLNTHFSKNIFEHIDHVINSTFSGKAASLKPVKSKAPLLKKKIPVVRKKVGTVKMALPQSSGTAPVVRSIINLPMLMMTINRSLHDQIKRNMGTGISTDILNYRTGRFAESAKVERLSESRQGMITAFYSYMKNPYATFSRGGRQERPYTRDPKLLISKSIRELAGQQIANRMRAVLV